MKMSKLLALALVLLISVGVLAGSTIAWFTDTVTSESNIIKAGELDVELSYADEYKGSATEWNLIDEDDTTADTKIFDYQLWEPGYSEVKYIKVKNAGNLAFQYQLNILSDTLLSADGANLADVIDVYFFPVDEDTTLPTSFSDVDETSKAGTLSALIANEDGAVRGVILPANGATDFDATHAAALNAVTGEIEACIILHMQETAGNEYQGAKIGNGFTIELLATQFTYENDSFNNQYDANPEWPEGGVSDLPQAKPETLNVDEIGELSYIDGKTGDVADGKVKLETAYKFKAPQSDTEAADSRYANWHADYVVSFDREVEAGTMGLAGQYDFYDENWVAFSTPIDVKAGPDNGVRLIAFAAEAAGFGNVAFSYETICSLVEEFQCGAFNLNSDNAGMTMTVELRLYEVDENGVETGNYFNINTTEYTFK